MSEDFKLTDSELFIQYCRRRWQIPANQPITNIAMQEGEVGTDREGQLRLMIFTPSYIYKGTVCWDDQPYLAMPQRLSNLDAKPYPKEQIIIRGYGFRQPETVPIEFTVWDLPDGTQPVEILDLKATHDG